MVGNISQVSPGHLPARAPSWPLTSPQCTHCKAERPRCRADPGQQHLKQGGVSSSALVTNPKHSTRTAARKHVNLTPASRSK